MKFFNSSKKWRFASSSITKYILAALLSLAGVQGVLAQNPDNTWTLAGSMNDWNASDPNYAFVRQDVSFAGNNYTHYLDLEFPEAGFFEYKLVEAGNNWYGMTTNINNTCKWLEWKSDYGNTTFNYNAGKYRFYINANSDQRRITVTGIFVTIEDPVQNADGSYTITGRFTNANPGQQNIHTYQIVFSEGVGQGVGANETTTDVEDGSFSFTTQKLTEGTQYTCNARIVDSAIGDHDSESVTFVAGQGHTDLNLYVRGENYNGWGYPGEDFKGVTTDGVTYTWDWISAPKKMSGSFKIAYCNINKPENWNNDLNFGLSTAANLTLGENGVWQGVLVATDGGDMTIDAANPWTVSMITFNYDTKKLVITTTQEQTPEIVDLWLRGEVDNWNNPPSDDWKASTADGVDYSWSFENPKDLYGSFKIATWDAETEDSWNDNYDFGGTYPDNSTVLARNAATGVATLTLVPKTPGVDNSNGNLILNETWQVTSMYFNMNTLELVINTVVDQPVYPITPTAESFVVTWTETFDNENTVTLTATVTAAEDAGFTMSQITGLVGSVFVNGEGGVTSFELQDETAVFNVPVTGVSPNDVLNYRLELTTGTNDIVAGVNVGTISEGSYTVPEPAEPVGSGIWLRGWVNNWAWIEGENLIDAKFEGKTLDGGTTVVWDWSDSPVEFSSEGADLGSSFKFDDAVGGEWGEGQWGYKAGNDFWIVQDLISSDGTVTITGLENHANASSLLFAEAICPVTVTRMELNTATRTLTIDCEITVPQKDLWFRSEIVEGGWGNDITDPSVAGIDEKWQGRTLDGVVYTWDWSGSKAVTLESGTEFKFGEYKGTSWAASGYAPNGQASVTSADFGKEISVQVAAGNFSAGEKITITKIILDTETLKLVLEGEKFTERFPVTVNEVNGENGSVVTDPSDITNMAVGETVTVTATPNEGYVALFEATSGCVMTDGDADNIKVFEVTAANPVITVTFQVQCQTVEPRFTISGQFNADFENDAVQYAGTAISSENADPKDGIWSDGARFIQLTANSVPANYFEWVCTGYAIDGVDQETVPEIAWTGQYKTSARAELSLPGTYTFVCNAKCNLGDDWTQSDTLTITAPVPAMGFDGVGIVGSSWDHTSAGREGEGLMTRQNGSLVWKSRSLKVNGFTDADEFVIIQQYKRYGCTPNNGWNGWNECQAVIGNDWGNKINGSNLNFSYVKWRNDAKGSNFLPVNAGSWVAGADGTDLQLVVTMTGYDSYTVELTKKIYANYSSNDETKGTVTMKVGDTTIDNGDDITAYIRQQVTLTASPAKGYKVASWKINDKVTKSDRTTISPKLSGDGLEVVVTFERDCNAGVVYDLTGGGVICAEGGKTELSLNTLKDVTYQLYKDGQPYGVPPVQGNGKAAKWTISEEGTYTAKAYDSRYEECEEQAIDMNGSAVVTSVTAPKITVNPGANVHLTVLQARSFTADVPVDWSITDVIGSGDYCKDDGYMISSRTDTSLVAKFLCIGTAKITATMKFPNKNCKAEVTVYQNGAVTELCAPEPEGGQ